MYDWEIDTINAIEKQTAYIRLLEQELEDTIEFWEEDGDTAEIHLAQVLYGARIEAAMQRRERLHKQLRTGKIND